MNQSTPDEAGISGAIASCDDGVIEGWVDGPFPPEAIVVVDVYIDGKLGCSGKARTAWDRDASDVSLAEPAAGRRWFEIRLPGSMRTGNPATVEIRLQGVKRALDVLDICETRNVDGAIESASNGDIKGWVIDGARPGQIITLELLFDDVVLQTLNVAATSRFGGTASFHFVLPDSCFDSLPHQIAVRVQGTTRSLRGTRRRWQAVKRRTIEPTRAELRDTDPLRMADSELRPVLEMMASRSQVGRHEDLTDQPSFEALPKIARNGPSKALLDLRAGVTVFIFMHGRRGLEQTTVVEQLEALGLKDVSVFFVLPTDTAISALVETSRNDRLDQSGTKITLDQVHEVVSQLNHDEIVIAVPANAILTDAFTAALSNVGSGAISSASALCTWTAMSGTHIVTAMEAGPTTEYATLDGIVVARSSVFPSVVGQKSSRLFGVPKIELRSVRASGQPLGTRILPPRAAPKWVRPSIVVLLVPSKIDLDASELASWVTAAKSSGADVGIIAPASQKDIIKQTGLSGSQVIFQPRPQQMSALEFGLLMKFWKPEYSALAVRITPGSQSLVPWLENAMLAMQAGPGALPGVSMATLRSIGSDGVISPAELVPETVHGASALKSGSAAYLLVPG